MRRLRVGCRRRRCPCTVVGGSGWATVGFEAVGRDELGRAVGASRCVGAIGALAHVVGDVPVVALVLRVRGEAVHVVRVVKVAHPARLRWGWGWSVGSQALGMTLGGLGAWRLRMGSQASGAWLRRLGGTRGWGAGTPPRPKAPRCRSASIRPPSRCPPRSRKRWPWWRMSQSKCHTHSQSQRRMHRCPEHRSLP